MVYVSNKRFSNRIPVIIIIIIIVVPLHAAIKHILEDIYSPAAQVSILPGRETVSLVDSRRFEKTWWSHFKG